MDDPKTVADLVDENGKCASCGHFAGVYETCPRCGADRIQRTSIKWIKYSAILLSTVGLFCLYLWARHVEVQTIRIKDITPTMNFAKVRIQGTVIRKAKAKYKSDKLTSITFRVCDASNGAEESKIWVNVYGDAAKDVLSQNKLPQQGDVVDIKGQIQVREGINFLIVQATDHLDIKVTPPLSLENLKSAMEGTEVRIRARIADIQIPAENSKIPVKIMLVEGKNNAQIIIWRDVYRELSEQTQLKAGQMIEAHVEIDEYDAVVQLQLRKADDLKILDATENKTQVAPKQPSVAKNLPSLPKNPPSQKTEELTTKNATTQEQAPLMLLRDIDNKHLGQKVSVTGTILKKTPFSQGAKWTVAQDGMDIPVVIWRDIQGEIESKFSIGAVIYVSGEVKQFKGKIELHLSKSQDIKEATESTDIVSMPQPKPKPIANFKPQDVNNLAYVQGKIVDRQLMPNGVRLDLQDDSGTLSLTSFETSTSIRNLAFARTATGKISIMLLRERFQFYRAFYELGKGYSLKVKGKLVQVESELQIQPLLESDMEVVSLPIEPAPKIVPGGFTSIDDRDLVITGKLIYGGVIPPGIKMAIVNIEGIPETLASKLDSVEQMEIVVLDPDYDEVERLRNYTNGSRIQARGKLGKFRNELQLQTIAADVQLIAAAEGKKERHSRHKTPSKEPGESIGVEKTGKVEQKSNATKTARLRIDTEEEPLTHLVNWQQIVNTPLGTDVVIVGKLARESTQWKLLVDDRPLFLNLHPTLEDANLAETNVKITGTLSLTSFETSTSIRNLAFDRTATGTLFQKEETLGLDVWYFTKE